LLPGAIAALRQLQAWGVPRIAATLAAISARIAQPLQDLGFSVLPVALRAPNILGASLPDGAAGTVVTALRAQDIFISQRGRSLRFAPHLHVDDHDVQRLVQALHAMPG
jgi:selenocysteine lyase/cysteine desulfurase